MAKNPKVDAFIDRQTQWQDEMRETRRIALACGLGEEIKWGKPCYTWGTDNVAIMTPLKESFVLNFFKGVLLSDPNHVLELPGENSRSARFYRFTNVQQIKDQEKTIRGYLNEAIDIEKQGLKVDFETNAELPMPVELQERLDGDATLRAAYDSLTPGRRRAYSLFISQAKQSKTRADRVEKYIPKIMDGLGPQD
jgi:uncharacterized protein YdeI (YjbR/CyaY-like superfamily)